MAKLGEGLKIKYEPIFPQAPVDEKFHYYETNEEGEEILKIREGNFKLILDINELREYVVKCKDKVIAFDTETTGLSYGIDKIVGFSLSLDSYSGIYVPIRHKIKRVIKEKTDKLDENGNVILTKAGRASTQIVKKETFEECLSNVNAKEALDILYEILINAKLVLMHNSEFDLNMFKFEGYDINKIKSFDTLVLPYLYDPEATALAGLKALEKRVLGRTVPEFKDVLGKDAENFAFVAPEDGYLYACYDKETEVLTEKGWMLWEDYINDIYMNKPYTFNVKGKPKLVTFNIEKENIEEQVPNILYKYKYEGKMECCKNKVIDYCVTSNHSMLVYRDKKISFCRADDLSEREALPVACEKLGIIFGVVNKEDRFQIDYNDYVYCAEVPNHTLFVRRNGKILICGNCYDTAGTYGVFQKMNPVVNELLSKFKNPLVFDGVPYNVKVKDNQMVKAFVDYYGHAKILVDREKAKKYKEQLEKEQRKVSEQIYNFFDVGIFNLSSNAKEFQAAMATKKVYTGIKSEKGAPSWSKKATAEMKRNLNKIKEGLLNWKKISFVDGKLSKQGIKEAYAFASALEIYGVYYFKIKSTINFLEIKGLKGELMDLKLFWLTVKHLYQEEMKKVEILELIQENNSLCKALNSYVDKLTQVNECYMHYRLKGTKSGRLSSGNGSKSDKRRNHYYIDLNAQNLTKPASAYYKAERCDESDKDSILGWKFTPLEKDYAMAHLEDLYIVEGQDPNITIRGCLKAPEGRYVVSLDYDAQEYKLLAVLSRDSLMLQNFYNGIDPHTASAYAIWGEENYDKGKRKKAKIFNFLNNYSGGAYTLSQQLDISEAEAQDMIDKYNARFHEMVAWKEQEIRKMYENEGVVFNAFGRPRQFKGWLKAIDRNRDSYTTILEKDQVEKASRRVTSAIERRVSSHIIQGTAGDILRLVMLKLYKKYFKNRDPHIDFMSTVHDEINYTIDKEYTLQYVKELESIMTFDTLDKTLPITTSTDIGFTYGNMFPFVWEDEAKTSMIPKRVHHA